MKLKENFLMHKVLFLSISVLFSNIFISCTDEVQKSQLSPYPEELTAKLSRGLVCFQKTDNNNFLSWRLLPSDPDNATFFIWRKISSSKEANAAIIDSTTKNNYMDKNIGINIKYSYGISTDRSMPEEFQEIIKNEKNQNFNALEFDLQYDYKQARVVTGDLTGDGELEVLILHSEMQTVDPFEKAWMKSTNSLKLAAFQKNGKKIWEIDLGLGIEAGYTYAPVIVWDLDADGKCEVILKTNKSDNPKNYSQEFITVLNGESGKVLREVRWPEPPSGNYNSDSRNFINIAHLDGATPSIIVGRGIYFKQVLCAYDINLNELWRRNFGSDIQPKFNNKYLNKIWNLVSDDRYRGSHGVPIADVDENGTEEILWGEHAITMDGKDLWKVEERIPYNGHLDIVYAADMIENIPGKEVFYGREGWGDKDQNIGMLLVDSKGNTIWSRWGYTHIDGGWAAKLIPDSNDWQFFGYDVAKKKWTPGVFSYNQPTPHLFNSKGEEIFNSDTSWVGSLPIDWEGDGIKEICTKDGQLTKYNGEKLLSLSKGVLWAADLFGDHREEIIYAPQNGKIYIIFNAEEFENSPKITRIADRQYRNDLSRTVTYYVIPTESGYVP
jgi:hypothetical protein